MERRSRTVSTYDAKAHLSRILAEVESGAVEVTITRHAHPIAKIIPITDSRPRSPGALKGKITLLPGWDEFTKQDDADWYPQ